MVALLTSVRNSPCFGGLRRTKTCHWQLFARPSTCFLCYFLHAAKSNNPSPCRGNTLRVLWSFEVLQTSNQCAASRLSQRQSRLNVPCFLKKQDKIRGVGAPPPTCTRKACVPLASQAFSGGKAALWRSLSGTFHLLLKKQDKRASQRRPPYLYTQSVYKYTTLRVHRPLASQA